ncbi:AMP-binding protein [Variovorax sp. GT1P44]|uniref:AMP-binding protein n=1 Tax=Variovorax sp. GT1P44 TaxID=3443742 RepID=UPI003F48FD53
MTSRPWFDTYSKLGLPATIDADRHPSVVHLLEDAMTVYADKPAFRSFGQTLSYADVDRLSAAFAAWLQQRLGVQRGDRVAVMMPNLLAFPIAFIGIARAGAVQVNVNPLYTPRELEHQLNDAGAEVIVIFNGSTPTLAQVIDRTGIKTVITVAPGDGSAADVQAPPIDARLTGTHNFADALREGMTMQRRPVALSGDDLLFLQYTGGTTGFSKGACLSHRNLVANTEQFKAVVTPLLVPGDEVIVTAIPLYHVFALMVNFLTYFSAGADNWLVANPRDIDGLIDVFKEARPTAFMGVNTLYAGLAMHPRLAEVDFSNLRLAGGGGAAVQAATSERWKAVTGHFIREGYGLSETSPVVSFNPASIEEFNGTTGLPMPGSDVRLLDDDGNDVPEGRAGEVCVKGPQVMSGYWNQPAANASAFTRDGYFRTGDVGEIDAQGYLKIVDRKKDMVIVSGFNVFPNEIEAVAASCPGVAESACIGVPDEKTGEALKLFVVKRPGAELTVEQIGAHCRSELTGYKIPRHIQFVDALPKSTVGKILRRELRAL